MSFNKPSAVQVATATNWITSGSLYNMLKPENDPSEAKVWGTQDLTGLIEMMGGVNYVASPIYRHFEEDRIHQIVVATGTGTGVVGATITYTEDATNYIANFPTSAVEPYVATGTQVNLMAVRVTDILIFPNGAQGVVTAVNVGAHTFDVTSTNGIALPTTTSTSEIINIGPTVGEGKDQPVSVNFREFVYSNTTETVNDSHSATGRSMGERTWVNYDYKGQSKASWYFKGQSATFKRFRNHREMKMLAGNKVVGGTGINAYDATLIRTEGLIPFCTSYNAQTTFSIISGLTLDDWQGIYTDTIDKNAGASEYSVLTAIQNRRAIESFIRDEMKNGGVQYNAFTGGEKQAVNFGFTSFQTLGYTSHLKTYQPFNDPTMLGANGHQYRNLTLFIPMSKDMFAIGEEKRRVEVPSIRINYLSNEGYNREWEEWLTGGANGTYTNTVDTLQINFRSEFGFEGFGANRFTALKGV